MDKKYEIIVYGATGFTGQICCKYLRDNYKDLVWAMAGRNKEKLDQIKSDFNLECDVIVADGADLEALRSLASQTKVVYSTAVGLNALKEVISPCLIDNQIFRH